MITLTRMIDGLLGRNSLCSGCSPNGLRIMGIQRLTLVIALLAMLPACQSSEKVLPVNVASALINGSIHTGMTAKWSSCSTGRHGQ